MTLFLCVVLFLEHFTGPIWHVVFGVILIIMTVGHLCKQMVKLRYQKPSVRLVDQVLFVSLAVLFVTGMLLHPLQGIFLIKIIHKLTAIVFVFGIIGHVAQHRTTGGKK